VRSHPAASKLVLEMVKQSEATLRAIEVTLEALRGAGFDPLHATEIARGALCTGLMLAMSEPGGQARDGRRGPRGVPAPGPGADGHAAAGPVPARDRVRGAAHRVGRP
jgi:hypothetical protein